MVYLLALSAALANALTSILQRMGVEDAPKEATLKLSLLTHAFRRGIWLLGFAFMVTSSGLQAVALHIGDLSQVQPILTVELPFLVLLLATWFRFRIGAREWLSCLAAAGGLAGFLIFARPVGGDLVPTGREWLVSGSICGAVVLTTVLLALRGPRWWRAAMFGTAGAVGFAFTATLIKTVSNYVTTDWVQMFSHWQTYALAVVGVGSLFLAQNAFHAGPIAASQTALVLVDPLGRPGSRHRDLRGQSPNYRHLRATRGGGPSRHVRRCRIDRPLTTGLGDGGTTSSTRRCCHCGRDRSGWPGRCETRSRRSRSRGYRPRPSGPSPGGSAGRHRRRAGPRGSPKPSDP